MWLSSCTGIQLAKFEKFKPLAVPATVLVIQNSVDKNPAKADKFLKLADKLDSVTEIGENGLTLEDFVKLGDEIGIEKEWSLLAGTLFEIYKPELDNKLNKLDTARKVLKEVAKTLRLAVNIVKPAK